MLLRECHVVHLVSNGGRFSLQEHRNIPYTNRNRFRAFQSKTLMHSALWHIIHDSVAAYSALTSAAFQGG